MQELTPATLNYIQILMVSQLLLKTNVTRASLLAGYTSSLVPDYTNTVRVQSTNKCVNFIDITLLNTTTTTTTTTP